MARQRPTAERRERKRIMHAQWYSGQFARRRMSDLPESYRAMLPASEDEGRLIDAERAIREQFAADQAATNEKEKSNAC
jgi:hypothetical protein